MKWFLRGLIVLAVLLGLVAAAFWATALRSEHPVGFQVTRGMSGDGPPFAIAVWYPTSGPTRPTTLLGMLLLDVAPDGPVAGRQLPLVVISHGNGGGPGSHADLAMALASAGYVVAAPMHPGDNYADSSAIGSPTFFNARNRQFVATIDALLNDWAGRANVDPQRIGAFGFSAGGFTVLTAVGAQPDLHRVARHCSEAPEFTCDVLRQAGSPLLEPAAPGLDNTFSADGRIKAAVVTAPGLGFTLDAAGLAGVRVPIQLWSGERDQSVPYATNTGPIRDALGSRVEFHAVPDAGHFSFLAPCGLLKPAALCTDADGFDRKAFHAEMNARVFEFFDRTLRGG